MRWTSMSVLMSINIHSRDRLRQCEGRHDEAGIEGGIALAADLEV